jgi:transposase
VCYLKILLSIKITVLFSQRGEIGALLRREGLYSSHLDRWRRRRTRGAPQGLTQAKRGRKAGPQAAENARLLRETVKLKAQLEQAELIVKDWAE